jgi:hypothetical protein
LQLRVEASERLDPSVPGLAGRERLSPGHLCGELVEVADPAREVLAGQARGLEVAEELFDERLGLRSPLHL